MGKMKIIVAALVMLVGCAHQEPVRFQTTPQVANAPVAQQPVQKTTEAPVAVEPSAAPVVEVYKGQAEQCAKAAPHSTSWDMHSCDDLARLQSGQKPVNDLDDWFAHQKVASVDAWLGLQTTNKSFAPTLVPIGHKVVLSKLKSPSSARFINEAVVLRCPDTDTFIAAYTVDAQNGFGAVLRDVICAGISAKDKKAVAIDCTPLSNIRFNLASNQLDSLPTNVRLMCELPAKMLQVK